MAGGDSDLRWGSGWRSWTVGVYPEGDVKRDGPVRACRKGPRWALLHRG